MIALTLILSSLFLANNCDTKYILKQKTAKVLSYFNLYSSNSNISHLPSRNFGLFFRLTNSFKIFPTDKNNLTCNKISYLKNNKLIFEPGYYSWGGNVYNLTKEGLYYLVDFKNKTGRYAIIFKRDVKVLLSSISWLISHGNRDNELNFRGKINKLIHHNLYLTCGSVSRLSSDILNSLNIKNRIVTFLTLDKWNSYDNGHTMIEVKIKDRWVLFDIDNNRYFQIDNKALSAKDFLEKNIITEMSFVMISKDCSCSNFYFKNINWNSICYYNHLNIKKWYKRVLQIPIIIKNGKFYTTLENKKSKEKVKYYYPNIIILDKQSFLNKFY